MRLIDLYNENNPLRVTAGTVERMTLKHPDKAGAIQSLIKKGIVKIED